MPESEVKPRHSAVAIAMIVIGLLILIPSGLCTTVFAGGALISLFTVHGGVLAAVSILTAALFVGGPFIALGLALLLQGLRR